MTGVSPSYSAHQRELAESVVETLRDCPTVFVATEEIDRRPPISGERRRPLLPLQGRAVFTRLTELARRGVDPLRSSTARTRDDRADYRPRAARRAKMLGVRSPLDEAEL